MYNNYNYENSNYNSQQNTQFNNNNSSQVVNVNEIKEQFIQDGGGVDNLSNPQSTYNQQSHLDASFRKQSTKYCNFTKNINISVLGWITIQETFSSYVVYLIEGSDEIGKFKIQRRYSEFLKLREILSQNWPGCYIPPIPPKKSLTVGKHDNQRLEKRKRYFDNFCKKISRLNHLYYSKEFKQFIHGQGEPEKEELDFMIEKYQNHFKELEDFKIEPEMLFKVSQFEGYLKKSKAALKIFKSRSKLISQAKANYNKEINNLVTSLLPDYEEQCLQNYGNQKVKIFSNKHDQQLDTKNMALIKNKDENNFQKIRDMIKIEIREIQAFEQIIQSRDFYEQLKNKAILKSKDIQDSLQKTIASKKLAKEDKINQAEKDLEKQQKMIDKIQIFWEMITKLIATIQVDKFKNEKEEIYLHLLKEICIKEIEQCEQLKQLWEHIDYRLECVEL